MDANQEEKIKRFLADSMMADAVYDVLLKSFLEDQKTTEVHTLAAERIAINLLQEAWKKLERLKAKENVEAQKSRQIGI